MKKFALIFVLAVLTPSLVLAWLAVRSLRDEQLILKTKEALLCQTVADSLAHDAETHISDRQREFALQVEALLAQESVSVLAGHFDEKLRDRWPLAEVGFVVSLDGHVLSPSLLGRSEARRFRLENDKFLCNSESVEVYVQTGKGAINLSQLDSKNTSPSVASEFVPNVDAPAKDKNSSTLRLQQKMRNVSPQQPVGPGEPESQAYSRLASSETEFRQLVGEANEGALARFLQNKLHVLMWYRSPRNRQYVFGAQLDRARLVQGLQEVVNGMEVALRQELCVALVDDTGKPVALTRPGFKADWKRPFAATEIGEILPHWEVAVYLLNPARFDQSAASLRLTLGLFITVLLLAIGVGSWLILADVRRQLRLVRQKTDFVSNVSHELKTPLTSIRMFSELLAEGRIDDPARQAGYLKIITVEAARLTRLINNVLDFSRMDRAEKNYHFQPCDLRRLAADTVESYRPHLEAEGFAVECHWPNAPVPVEGDVDALAQVVVNMLSNAEKYCGEKKEITIELEEVSSPVAHAELRVLDRGLGLPRGCEEKIFEQFYRAHDSLDSGIQGSGLGLTLARQIARAHRGDVTGSNRPAGGSCFILRLPLARAQTAQPGT